jgi:recombinase
MGGALWGRMWHLGASQGVRVPNRRTCGGCVKDGVGTCRHPSVRVVNEVEATVGRRIFEMTREGLGLAKIRGVLNREGIPGPRGAWATTGVREILHRRDYLGQVITNRYQRARADDGNAIRIEQARAGRRPRRIRPSPRSGWSAATSPCAWCPMTSGRRRTPASRRPRSRSSGAATS